MPDESRHYHHLNNHADVQSFGMTAHRYLVEQRIDVAKTLLLHTNQTGLEIALESGFKDQATFSLSSHSGHINERLGAPASLSLSFFALEQRSVNWKRTLEPVTHPTL